MLSLRAVRRLCAALDTVAITVIAANLSRLRSKTDVAAAAAHPATHNPDTFPTIAACRAAIAKTRASSNPEASPNPHTEASPADNLNPEISSEPALFRIKAERDPEKLLELFKANAHNSIVVENRFAFEDAVSRLSGARRFDLIEHLLEHQKTLPQGRREGFIVRIITLYGRAGMPEHALKTFDEMHLYGCPQSVKSFNATIKVLSESRRFDEVWKLFEECPVKYGIELDEISYNTIIKVLCEMGFLDSAYMVMVEMEKVGLKPDVITYTTLMSASYKCGRRELGDGLWNLMVLRQCLPNLATYNVRIQFLINRRRGWQANSLMRKMEAVGIKPDELTYNLIIKGFCMMDELEMAKRIFFALHGRGCKTNNRIYQTMVHYLCKGGEFDLAFRLCKESMERNWFPSVDTIDSMLKGLMKSSRDREAKKIMKLVQGRIPPYSVDELKNFQAIILHGKTK